MAKLTSLNKHNKASKRKQTHKIKMHSTEEENSLLTHTSMLVLPIISQQAKMIISNNTRTKSINWNNRRYNSNNNRWTNNFKNQVGVHVGKLMLKTKNFLRGIIKAIKAINSLKINKTIKTIKTTMPNSQGKNPRNRKIVSGTFKLKITTPTPTIIRPTSWSIHTRWREELRVTTIREEETSTILEA